MLSLDTKFIYKQPSTLVKKDFGGTQCRKQLIDSRWGQWRSHRNMYLPENAKHS